MLSGLAVDVRIHAHDHGLAVDESLGLLVAVAGGNDERFTRYVVDHITGIM
jgi:hypothetical protein